MQSLTGRQRQVLAALIRYQETHEMQAPSAADIGEMIGVGRQVAREHLLALEKKGYTIRVKGKFVAKIGRTGG